MMPSVGQIDIYATMNSIFFSEQYYLGVFVLLCMAIMLSAVTINMAHEVHTRPPYLLTRVSKLVNTNCN